MVSRDSGGLEEESNRVMPALVAGIHVLLPCRPKTWMAGTTPGHDGLSYLMVLTGRRIA
jgi:hypothetical protein